MKKPHLVVHPGEIISDELEARSKQCKTCKRVERYTQQQFCKDSGIAPRTINEIIKGKRRITPTVAKKLEKAFKISATFWLNNQNDYDLYKLNTP